MFEEVYIKRVRIRVDNIVGRINSMIWLDKEVSLIFGCINRRIVFVMVVGS